jgi:16S rRNA (cytosine967-C5)-methyltransferase
MRQLVRSAPTSLSIAEQVIAVADRNHPADQVLRETLRRARPFPTEAAGASRAVFSYYRWYRWLDPSAPRSQQIRRAGELAGSFARDPGSVPDSDLVRLAVPDWVHEHVEITPALARALQEEPRVWIRARAGQGSTLATMLGSCRRFDDAVRNRRHDRTGTNLTGQPAPGTGDILLYEGEQDLFRTPQFQSGQFEIQDISSQAVGLVCAAAPGQSWWDACAGEGGKTLHLSDLMENKGLIWASDRSESRLRILRRRAARARIFNFRTILWNGGVKPPTKTLFDGILVDAPCTGVGTWQRNPHARWTTTPNDVHELGEVQKRLLRNAATQLKPGGRLIYSACTLTRGETSEVAEFIDRELPGCPRLATGDPLRPELPPGPQVIYFPQDFGGNGMFIAVWFREKE